MIQNVKQKKIGERSNFKPRVENTTAKYNPFFPLVLISIKWYYLNGDKMINSEILNSLNSIGLTHYESKVYATLAVEGTATAKEISNICGIPYGKVYEVITSLSKKGFVLVLPTKPIKYKAVEPTKVIEIVKQNSNRKIENAEKIIKKEISNNFRKNKKVVEPQEMYWLLNGRMAINSKMGEFFRNAEDHVYILTSENGLNRLAYYAEILKTIRSKGVDVIILSKITKKNSESAKSLSFCQIYNMNNSISTNFVSVDCKESLFFEAVPDDENTKYGMDRGIWARSPSFTQFLEQFFKLKKYTDVTPYAYDVKAKKIKKE